MNQTKDNEKEFSKLLEKDPIPIPKVGDTVSGRVISTSKSEVKVDINGVMTGVIRGRELYFSTNDYTKLPINTEIEATLIDIDNENGELELSFRHIDEQKSWALLQKNYADKTNIKVKVLDANRGGLIVALSQLTGFLPVSQLAPNNYPRVSGGDKTKILEKLKTLVGSELEVKIIALDENEKKFIVSEKDAWQDKQKDVISRYKVGSIVEGVITAITGFGLFINFDNDLEGLIHISELAWQRIDDINELYKIGDKIRAEIISIDGSKIFLSAKKLVHDPWRDVAKKYKVGQKVTGTVLKVNPFGLFVELDKDIHGLAHVSQLALKPGQKITEAYTPNSKAEFIIISLEPDNHRLGLASINKKVSRASSSNNPPEDNEEEPKKVNDQSKKDKSQQDKQSPIDKETKNNKTQDAISKKTGKKSIKKAKD
ncbi:S1 RNA-binding domain-containing protein [Patescibacteria group bacterium]|jgi:ribosomal protein S1|nr:S1 RNA-binding domain-containing protein [Patescibacteria group bacterium]HPD07854.1 S1 RNA-binding domain-containing protein [bacterium]HRT11124.1 S1 RNA-binding domain-containing protein [Patescibacteria group bacterium]HRU89963.1 S1 RNA-binding domain-containing protein [Patescibacteria group bacterium]